MQAGGPTCWSAKHQDMVLTLTMEAEYISLGRAREQILWEGGGTRGGLPSGGDGGQ